MCLCWLVSLLWPLCFSPFALGLSVVLLVVCVAVSPPSPSVVPGWRPGPIKLLLDWSLPLGIWLLLATAWLPYLLLGVLWCSASSLHVAPRQQRPLALCGVTGLPSTPWGICCCGALRSFTEVFIFMMIQVPPSTPLSYALATLAGCVTSSFPVLVCLPGAPSSSDFFALCLLFFVWICLQCSLVLLHLGD